MHWTRRRAMPGLISYIDSNSVEWVQFRPGSRWKTLFEDPKTGQRAILVQWDPGIAWGRSTITSATRSCTCYRAHSSRMDDLPDRVLTFTSVQVHGIRL